MKRPWLAERTVDPTVARTLIRSCGVAADRVELLGEGWDNIVYVVDGQWVFRFPRRQFGADAVAVERLVLSRLAGRVPLAVPEPLWLGEATDEFPWPFTGFRLVEGETACRAGLDEAQRRRAAPVLGAFLKAVHGTETSELVDGGLPGDRIGRGDVERRLPFARECLPNDAGPQRSRSRDRPAPPRPDRHRPVPGGRVSR